MFLHKRTNILGILGVFVTLLLIILFSSSSIRDQARIISSFAQAQCSKECNVDDKNSCGSPFVCKPKCNGNICSFKAGTCEFPECPAGQKCGCTRPTIPPWKGHENYPPSGYTNLQIKLNFKSTYYNPAYHLKIVLQQSVRTKEGKDVRAEIEKLIPLKKGVNTIDFYSVPLRSTRIEIVHWLRNERGSIIDAPPHENIKIDFSKNCIRVENSYKCMLDEEFNAKEQVGVDFEITAKPRSEGGLNVMGTSATHIRNEIPYIKTFLCDLDKDQKCATPTTIMIKAGSNDRIERKSYKLPPGRKKVYFDTKYLYDVNDNIIRQIHKAHIGQYYDSELQRNIDWHNEYNFFISAFDRFSDGEINVRLTEANIETKQVQKDIVEVFFSGKPKYPSFIKLTPCGFENQNSDLTCFEEASLLKPIAQKRDRFNLIDYKNKFVGWKIHKELYDANGQPTGERFETIALGRECSRINNIDKDICMVDHTQFNSFEFSTRFENNYANNKNLVDYGISVFNYDTEIRSMLEESFSWAYVKVKICSGENDCDALYPKLLKLVDGAWRNGDAIDLPALEFNPNSYVQLDGFLYNQAGLVSGPIPKQWNIETKCYEGGDQGIISPEKSTCRFSSQNRGYYSSRFVIKETAKVPAVIAVTADITKKRDLLISNIEREICATQSGYLCRKLQDGDFTIQDPNDSLERYGEKLTLLKHADFSQGNVKKPFFADEIYFIKYIIETGGKKYERVAPVASNQINTITIDLNTLPPLENIQKTKRKVKVLLHNYYLNAHGKNTFDALGKSVDYAKSLATQVASALSLPNNPVNYEIIEYVELNSFPSFTKDNSLELLQELFSKCVLGRGLKDACDQISGYIGVLDYVKLEEEMNLCKDVNDGKFDELWHVNMPYTPVGESDIFGPYPVNINGITAKISKCEKNVPTLGIDITRAYALAMHSFGHRAESLRFVFDDNGNGWYDWKSPPENIFEEFVLTDNTHDKSGKPHIYSGCGNIHFPPNVIEGDNDWYRETQSICDDFTLVDPPRTPLARKPKLINCNAWGCTEEGYYTWWLMHLPTGEGKDEKGRMNNWWQYVIYTENLVKDSVIAKLMVLDQNKNGIFDKADYDAFVTETKSVSLKNQNTILDQNNDQKLTTTDFSFYKSKIGTELPEITHKHDHIFKFPR